MKSVRIRSFFGPYFSAFGLNTDQKISEYGHFSRSVKQYHIVEPIHVLELEPILELSPSDSICLSVCLYVCMYICMYV